MALDITLMVNGAISTLLSLPNNVALRWMQWKHIIYYAVLLWVVQSEAPVAYAGHRCVCIETVGTLEHWNEVGGSTIPPTSETSRINALRPETHSSVTPCVMGL